MARRDLPSGNRTLRTGSSRRTRVATLLVLGALFATAVTAQAGQITISWDPDPDPTTIGYRVYNARGGQPFAAPVDVGNVSAFNITGLSEGVAYHAAVSAYDSFGQESPLSAEVVYNARKDGAGGGDADQDGLPDALEVAGCTSATDADSDDDGIPDGTEDANHNGVRDASETSACVADTDGDGLQDGTETGMTIALAGPGTNRSAFRPDLDPATATDPLAADTDGDGLADGGEDLNANGRLDVGETDPLRADNNLLFSDSFSDGTRVGDPSWKRISGGWSVTGTARRLTSAIAPVNLTLIADPNVQDFRSGRIVSSVVLTRTSAASPNARIVFHYQDGMHYRYVRLTGADIAIGQIGSNPVEKAGVKASLRRKLKVNTEYQIRVDIVDGTEVKVYLNDEATPVLSHRFLVSSSGRVGYRTEGARSLFDDTAVWNDLVLP